MTAPTLIIGARVWARRMVSSSGSRVVKDDELDGSRRSDALNGELAAISRLAKTMHQTPFSFVI
jgi:hypothetical protein